MPRFEEYVALLAKPARGGRHDEERLGSAIRQRVAGLHDARRAPLFPPWAPTRTVATQRLFAAEVSFIDDYEIARGKLPPSSGPGAAFGARHDAPGCWLGAIAVSALVSTVPASTG